MQDQLTESHFRPKLTTPSKPLIQAKTPSRFYAQAVHLGILDQFWHRLASLLDLFRLL